MILAQSCQSLLETTRHLVAAAMLGRKKEIKKLHLRLCRLSESIERGVLEERHFQDDAKQTYELLIERYGAPTVRGIVQRMIEEMSDNESDNDTAN